MVEGTLSDGWVDSLESCWIQARAEACTPRVCINLSSVTYVDDKGRELLMRLIRDGVQLKTGILTKEVINEITNDVELRQHEQVTQARNAA